MLHPGSIVILDFGGQYAHLIANRVRRLGAYSEIRTPETPASELKGVAGIILSGGPQSVYEEGSPQADPKIFDLGVPVLGLCYGHQWLAQTLGGKVEPGKTKEYGPTKVEKGRKGEKGKNVTTDVLASLPDSLTTWMSHGDVVTKVPEGFSVTLTSENDLIAGMADPVRRIFGIQFHIEVTHTEHGMEILENFVKLCDPAPWSIDSFASYVGDQVKKEVGEKKVFMLVSGGVDSTVAFTLLNEVLGHDRVQGLLVDTGLMRKNEIALIKEAFEPLGITNLRIEDASEEFFHALDGVYEPEAKRKAIGDTFLAVQKRVSEEMNLRIEDGWMLGQGTIYPDMIETGGTKHADHIKTHHNRVDAIQKLIEQGLVIEPLKELYKDEVRTLGEELGLPRELVWRHPFPGPGLGVRILCAKEPFKSTSPTCGGVSLPHCILPVKSVGVQGDGRTYRHAVALFAKDPVTVTPEHLRLATEIPNRDSEISRVLLCTSQSDIPSLVFTPGYITRAHADLLREVDDIAQRIMREDGLGDAIWQFPVVLVPFGTAKGGQSIVLRPISSTDAMTANAFVLPPKTLKCMTDAIMAIDGIDLVFLDLTNKPPGTIEWE